MPSTTKSVIRWLQLKRYQYEVTFPLYMLTPVERFVLSKYITFSLLLLLLLLLLFLLFLFSLSNPEPCIAKPALSPCYSADLQLQDQTLEKQSDADVVPGADGMGGDV